MIDVSNTKYKTKNSRPAGLQVSARKTMLTSAGVFLSGRRA